VGAALSIRTDLASPARLRRLARRERNPRAATRMLAIAGALEGRSRAEAARLAGMERQALRDAVLRFNTEGLEGLRDRPKPGRPPALTEAEQAVLLDAIFRGPDRARDGCADWTLPALCAWIEGRFGKRLHPASLSRVVRRLDLSRQKTRPLHPQADERAKAAFAKGGFRAPWRPSPRPIRASGSRSGSRTRPGLG
jgi:transposase